MRSSMSVPKSVISIFNPRARRGDIGREAEATGSLPSSSASIKKMKALLVRCRYHSFETPAEVN